MVAEVVKANFSERLLVAPTLNYRTFDAEYFRAFVAALRPESVREYESYCVSPGYYELTGRNGCWMIEDDNGIVVTCVHPNRPGTMLLFPEISNDPKYTLTFQFLSTFLNRGVSLRLARYSKQQRQALFSQLCFRRNLKLGVVTEDVLDWRYPVRILGTTEVLARRGGSFEQIRQRLRKLDVSTLRVG